MGRVFELEKPGVAALSDQEAIFVALVRELLADALPELARNDNDTASLACRHAGKPLPYRLKQSGCRLVGAILEARSVPANPSLFEIEVEMAA